MGVYVGTDSIETALAIFRRHGGVPRTSESIRQGIHPRTLYALRDSGVIQSLSRGLYRLADLPPLSNPDLVIVARKFPQAVICLVSALAFHKLTTQVPHAVDVALPSRVEHPAPDYPPIRTFWLSGRAWSEGIQTYRVDDTPGDTKSASVIAGANLLRITVNMRNMASREYYIEAAVADLGEC